MTHQHDASHWIDSFKPMLEDPEFHLAEHLKTNLVPLYWVMRAIPSPVLEVGCGSARGAILIKRLQPWRRVLGLDIDPQVCELAIKYASLVNVNIEVDQGDVFKLPFIKDEFSAIFSSGLLEHYSDEDIVKAMQEQLRVAEIVIASVPTDHYYYQRGKKEYGDERMIDKMHWIKLFSEAGKIIEMSFVGGLTEENGIHAVVGRR